MRLAFMIVTLGLFADAGFTQAQSQYDEALALAIRVAEAAPNAVRLAYGEHVKLRLVAEAYREGNLRKADGIWGSLIRDLVIQGGALPNFDSMIYLIDRTAFLEEDEKLSEPANRLRFAIGRLRVIREELTVLEDRIQESSAQDEVDRLLAEKKEREIAEAIAEQTLEDAKRAYENVIILQDARRLLQESYERKHAIVRQITSTH